MFNPSTPVTGLVTTGFTNPTYGFALGQAPNAWSRRYTVNAINGTQAGVDPQSASRPFDIVVSQPQALRTLSAVDVNGVVRNVPYNVYGAKTTKGLTVLAGQASKNGTVDTRMSIPAGADLADQPNVKAMLGFHIGMLSNQANGLAQTAIDGSI